MIRGMWNETFCAYSQTLNRWDPRCCLIEPRDWSEVLSGPFLVRINSGNFLNVFPFRPSNSLSLLTMNRSPPSKLAGSKKRKRTNKPSGGSPLTWPGEILVAVEKKLKRNLTSKGKPYIKKVALANGHDVPSPLLNEVCWHPAGSARITHCDTKKEYASAIHRLNFLLANKENKVLQASHICPDWVNTNGRGEKHCCNPSHMVNEDDKTNKSRQRCAGWIWITPYDGNPGNYWYPSCQHTPPCLVFTPKATQVDIQLLSRTLFANQRQHVIFVKQLIFFVSLLLCVAPSHFTKLIVAGFFCKFIYYIWWRDNLDRGRL